MKKVDILKKVEEIHSLAKERCCCEGDGDDYWVDHFEAILFRIEELTNDILEIPENQNHN
jgi:hypothetical protein